MVSFSGDQGEAVQGLGGRWVRQYRDLGEWKQGEIPSKVRAYGDQKHAQHKHLLRNV